MSWIFSKAMMEACESLPSSPGQEAESSAESCSDGEQYAQLNVKPTQHKFWRNDKPMDHSNLSRFGLTLRLLTDDHGEAVLTSFLEGFPVRTLAAQGRGQESREKDQECGRKWLASLAKYDPDTRSWRTAQCSLLGGWEEFSETWPQWGIMRDGECWELSPMAHHTREKESGLLPTPSGVNGGTNHVMGRLDEWGGSSNPFRGTETGRVRCASFEEWMMGWPTAWSALTELETDKFQQWQQQHSVF